MRKLVWLLFPLLLLLAGCAPDRVRTIKAYDEWGRGRQVGRLFAQTQIGLAVTPDGDQLAVLFGSRANPAGADRLSLVVLDEKGEIGFSGELAIEITEPRTMQLLASADGRLHLFWFEGFAAERQLRYALVKPDGQIIADSLKVSSASGIYWYKAAWTPAGTLQLLWVDVDGGLNAAIIDDNSLGGRQNLLGDVLSADFQVADDNTLFLTWSEQINEQQRQFFFATLAEPGPISNETPVSLFGAAPSAARGFVGGPSLALDRTHVYIAWTRRQNTPVGVVDRISFTTLARAEIGTTKELAFTEPAGLDLVPFFPPPSAPASGAFPYESLGVFNPQLLGAAQNNGIPATLAGERDETVLTLASNFNTRSRSEVQPTLFYLRNGAAIGYQPLTWTDKRSNRVLTVADAANNLYTAWYDADTTTADYPVYIITTNPLMNQAAAGLTLADIGFLLIDFIGRIGNGISLIFVTLAWPFTGFAVVFLAYWFNEGELYDRRGYIVLVLSVLVYLAAKLLFLSDISRALPGLSFVSPGAAIALIYLVPAGITLVSSAVTYLTYLRRVGGDLSVMRAALQIILVDYAISMMVYSIGRFE